MNIQYDPRTRAKFQAYIGLYLSFKDYMSSYKNAFDALMENVNQSGLHVDRIAYPILFIARHCMELGFKANIRHFIKYSGKEDYKKASTHNLADLFDGFKLHVKETIKHLKEKYNTEVDKEDLEDFNKHCDDVAVLTDIFHLLDKHSDSFRYPVKNDNQKHFEPNEIINLLDINDLFEKSMVLLEFTSSLFSKYTAYIDEIEEAYLQELQREQEKHL